jgi:hypothetical protein
MNPTSFPTSPIASTSRCRATRTAGQIVPFGKPLIVPSRYGARYAYGAFTEGQKQMVVSGGLGNTTLPFRIGRPTGNRGSRTVSGRLTRPAPGPIPAS